MNSQQESKRDSKGLIPAYGGELKELKPRILGSDKSSQDEDKTD